MRGGWESPAQGDLHAHTGQRVPAVGRSRVLVWSCPSSERLPTTWAAARPPEQVH